jgi:hypothetical protein
VINQTMVENMPLNGRFQDLAAGPRHAAGELHDPTKTEVVASATAA